MSGSQELFTIDVNILSFTIPDKEGTPIESSCNIHNITGDYIAFRKKKNMLLSQLILLFLLIQPLQFPL